MMTRTQLRVRVSLLSAQSNNGPSKLGQSDVPVTGDRRVGGQQGSSPNILVVRDVQP